MSIRSWEAWEAVEAGRLVFGLFIALGAAFGTCIYLWAEVSSLQSKEAELKRQVALSIGALDTLDSALDDLESFNGEIDRLTRSELEKAVGKARTRVLGQEGLLSSSTQEKEVMSDDATDDGDRLRVQAEDLATRTGRLARRSASLLWAYKNRGDLITSLPTRVPAEGPVSSEFGMRISPTKGVRMFHKGLDIAASPGSVVVAPGDGTVRFAGKFGGFGNFVAIEHGHGIVTKYAHNEALLITAGEQVKRGQPIAKVGASGRAAGIHLHYEVWIADRPVDPRLVMDATPHTLTAMNSKKPAQADDDVTMSELMDESDPKMFKAALAEFQASSLDGALTRKAKRKAYVMAYLKQNLVTQRPLTAGQALVAGLGGLMLSAFAWWVYASFGPRRRDEIAFVENEPDESPDGSEPSEHDLIELELPRAA